MVSARRALTLLLRLLLGSVFLYAAVTKLAAPAKFAQEIANYRMLPGHLVPAAAAALPVSEAAIGLLLLAGVWVSDASLAGTLLLGLFTIAVGSSLARGIDLVCGCFGGQELVSPATLVRDLALTAAAVLLCLLSIRAQAPVPAAPPE